MVSVSDARAYGTDAPGCGDMGDLGWSLHQALSRWVAYYGDGPIEIASKKYILREIGHFKK